MSRSSRVSPWSRRSLNSTVFWARASSLRPCISGSRAPTRGTSSASLLTFLPSPARRTFVNTLMRGTILPAATGREPPLGMQNEIGLRAADLVFDPTLACREGDAPAPAVRRRAATPNGTLLARITSSPPAPDSRGRSGQGLPLSRTMLSDHKSPYVGRFACDWPRLSTTDPHAALGHPTPGGHAYCPGTCEPAEPEALPALAGVAPSSTVTSEIFQTPFTCFRSATNRTTSASGDV